MRLQHADRQMDTATVCTERGEEKYKVKVLCNTPEDYYREKGEVMERSLQLNKCH